VIAAALVGQAAGAGARAAHSTTPSKPPPPPYTSQTQFREAALRMGVGGCDDLPKIRAAPQKQGSLGADPYWDRIAVHPQQYRVCLVEAISDRRLVHGISFGPGTPASTVGDVAHALLVEIGFIPWGMCLPPAVSHSSLGAIAARDWLKSPGHRTTWEACIRRALVPGKHSSGRRVGVS
jgi:hypothetical protein